MKEIVSRWPDSGILVENAKEAVNQPNVAVELTTIMRCYSCLLPLLPKFESQSFSLFEGFQTVMSLNFHDDPCEVALYAKKRLD